MFHCVRDPFIAFYCLGTASFMMLARAGMKHVYGAETPARGILKAIYTPGPQCIETSSGFQEAAFLFEESFWKQA